MGAAELQVSDYQNVTIRQYFLRYLPANHDEKSATIIRKDWLCSAGTASQKFVAGIGLNAMDLHARYGEPNMERFAARPGITMTVAYGTDQAACQIVVEPPRSIIPRVEPIKYMRPEVVSEIIDEVLSEANRGELLLSMVTKSGRNEFETIDYQNLTIYRFRHKSSLPNPEIEEAAIVKPKDLTCGNGQN